MRPPYTAPPQCYSSEVLSFDEGCGDVAAKTLAFLTKKGQIIGQNDVLIAAAMSKHGCNTILTRNTNHYDKIPGITTMKY